MYHHIFENAIMSFTPQLNDTVKDQLSIESDCNTTEYCLNIIQIGLVENKVKVLCPFLNI